MDSIKYPPIYFRILKSRLVSQKDLDQVYEELCGKLSQLHDADHDHEKTGSTDQNSAHNENSGEETAFILSDPSLLEDVNQDKTDFELGIPLNNQDSASMELSDASREINLYTDSPYEEEMERFLPAELELRGLINRWQVSQLLHSRTRFTLGQYRMIDSLGVGGYGHVFLARPSTDPCNLRSNQCRHPHKNDVAIKVLPLAQSNEMTVVKFLREVELNRFIRHPNITRFIESAHDGNVHYSVYEYVNGGDIRRLITRFERLDYEVAASIISQTAQGLQSLHSINLVHRDIKPGNILITRDGIVKLTDLGLAIPFTNPNILNNSHLLETIQSFDAKLRELDEKKKGSLSTFENQKPKKRKVAGTPDYIAPDQIRNSEDPTPLWDIYSLGCTFYFMITGIVPFPAGTTQQKIQAQLYCDPPEPRMFNSQIPEELSRFIVQMMNKLPESRVQTANDIIDFLAPWTLSPSKLAFRLLDQKNDSDIQAHSLLNTKYSDNDDSFLRKVFEKEEDPVQNQEIDQNIHGKLYQLIPPPTLSIKGREDAPRQKDPSGSGLHDPGLDVESLEQWAVFLSFYVLIPLLLLAILIMFFYLAAL